MTLQDQKVSQRIRLATLWASLTSCYIYCDYFELYQPGKLQSMLSGIFGPMGQTTQGILFSASVMLAIPAIMISLCTFLSPNLCRVTNMALGVVYTVIMAAVLPGTWYYYKMFAIIEIYISLTIAWLAFKWPRVQPSGAESAA